MKASLFNDEVMFTLNQALQLVGLVPSVFVIAFLLSIAWHTKQSIIPILYFISLASGFTLPLLDIYPALKSSMWVNGGLLMGESLLVAFSFLLICQFLMGRIPPWPYWLVLLIPVTGGGMILYASMLETSTICKNEACPDVHSVKTLYHLFSSSLMFLLLVIYSSRFSNVGGELSERKHKYWLIISLIALHLFILLIDLLRMTDQISVSDAALAVTTLRLTFIYLVLTSLFRVFYPNLVGEVLRAAQASVYNPALDMPHVETIKKLLGQERIYREMRLNRAALAEKLGISEYALSRLINHHFGKNFNELINGYRIDEAKARLRAEPDQQVTVIGFEVGFNSIASFNRVFKEKVGMSPSEWRGSK